MAIAVLCLALVSEEAAYADDPESVCAPFPAGECARELAVALCESDDGRNPRAYDLWAANGGRLQINKYTWEDFFWANYGWAWADIVLDDGLNRQAAYVIWGRAGYSWSPWTCRGV